MDVYQCPECELRFRSARELDDHISLDHPEFEAEGKPINEVLAEAHRRRKTSQ